MAGDGAFSDARALETGGFQGRAHLVDRTQTHSLVAHDAVIGFVMLAFELGLDQADEDGARLREARERGRQGRQADEAQVGHQQVERRTQLDGVRQLDVGAFEHRHARGS